jgi:hypothetical protein
MLLKMKTTLAGPEFTVQADELWECTDAKLAKQLIDDGNAIEAQHDGILEMTSTFHGGLKAVSRELHEAKPDIPPPADGSQAKEAAEVVFPLDRRTADELVADLKAGVASGELPKPPDPPVTSDQMALKEIAAKTAAAKSMAAPSKDAPRGGKSEVKPAAPHAAPSFGHEKK